MPPINQYRVLFYGSPDGVGNKRAEIKVFEDANPRGDVRFHDPGMPFPNDSLSSDGRIIMHLPSVMFANVLDVLRNEKPINYHFALGRAVLSTSDEEREPAGEGE